MVDEEPCCLVMEFIYQVADAVAHPFGGLPLIVFQWMALRPVRRRCAAPVRLNLFACAAGPQNGQAHKP